MNILIRTCAVALAIAPFQSGTPASLALTGGTIIDVRSGRSIAEATIVIRGERILEVGRATDVHIPADARVVSLKDRWIVPGLVDMHVHVSTTSDVPLELYVANGVTSVRDLGGNVTLLRLMREHPETPQDRPRPRLFFAGAILDGRPPSAPRISIMVDSPDRAASAVNLLVDQTADVIKVYNGITEPVLQAIVTAARTRAVPVVGHVPRALTVRRAVELGMSGIEHAALRGADLLAWGVLTQDEADRIAAMPSVTQRATAVWAHVDLDAEPVKELVVELAKRDVFFDPTLSIDEYDTLFLYDVEADHPNNRYLSRAFVEVNLGSEHDIFRVPAALRVAAADGLAKRKQFVYMSYRAGVTIVAGTDGPGIGRLAPGFGLHRELELLVEAGLTPLDALRAATINAAKALDRQRELGTLEAGKYADLVVLRANPLDDIRNTASVDAVVAAGRYFDSGALAGLLRRLEDGSK